MDLNPIDVQKNLKGVSYPASKAELVEAARANGGGDDLIEQLEGLSEDRFEGPNEVMKALGKS